MVSNKHPLVAREGWLFLGLAALAAVATWLALGPLPALPLVAIFAFLIYLYRDPRRRVPAAPLGIVSPADGEVIEVGQVKDPYGERQVHRIAIRMRPFGVFSIRGPIEGKVVKHWYPSAETPALERRYALQAVTDEGDDVAWAIRAGRPQQRPQCYVQPGERIGQGQRCGFLFLGGVVEVYLPVNSSVHVEAGDKAVAGETILATLIHRHAVIMPTVDEGVVTH